MREVTELGEDERGALVVGQLVHVGEELPELGTLLDLFAQPLRGDLLEILARLLPAGTQDR
jgi:hypothetical protein